MNLGRGGSLSSARPAIPEPLHKRRPAREHIQVLNRAEWMGSRLKSVRRWMRRHTMVRLRRQMSKREAPGDP
jgi:hypothetical protein